MIKGTQDKHSKESLKKAIACALVVFCISILCGAKGFPSLLVSTVGFVLSFSIFVYLPRMKAKRKAKMVEKDLPFALMAIGIELGIGISFEKALANRKNKSDLGREINKVIHAIRTQGLSVQEALIAMSTRIESKNVKRAVIQMINIYEHGSKEQGEVITRLAKELLARQKAEAKEFSGKIVMTSLLFIVVSAIVPGLLLSYITVGSMFMNVYHLDDCSLDIL